MKPVSLCCVFLHFVSLLLDYGKGCVGGGPGSMEYVRSGYQMAMKWRCSNFSSFFCLFSPLLLFSLSGSNILFLFSLLMMCHEAMPPREKSYTSPGGPISQDTKYWLPTQGQKRRKTIGHTELKTKAHKNWAVERKWRSRGRKACGLFCVFSLRTLLSILGILRILTCHTKKLVSRRKQKESLTLSF